MPLRLHNTLTKRVEDFIPGDPAHVTFYSCGPTVYDDAHIGNFRSFLAADVLRRFIESPLCELANESPAQAAHRKLHGRRVTHVMNITDVGHMTDDAEGGEAGEDRMAVAGRRLLEAKKAGTLPADAQIDPGDPYAIAAFYANRFLDDARTLGLKVAVEAQKDPTLMPRPSAKIGGMVAMILNLLASGNAYAVGPPGRQVVYFDVQSFRGSDGALLYGRLSGNTLDGLRTGAGGRISDANQAQKKHAADFLLWKADPAHIMKWDPAAFDARATWGAGYPGWHIECSVMAAERLGTVIDLHSGGEDNIFPHHECEIAQSCCAHGTSAFARCWFHGRHLLVNGDKMSKSKGNFYTIRDLLALGYEPAAIRLELIRTHHTVNANFTLDGLRDAARMVERWRRAAFGGTNPERERGALAAPVLAAFAAALHDDLNVAGAIGAINSWIGAVTEPSESDRAALALMDRVLGVLALEKPAAASTAIGIFLPGTTPDPAVLAKLEARREAKARKDFKASDAIRDELAAMGLAIKDVAGGKVEVSRR